MITTSIEDHIRTKKDEHIEKLKTFVRQKSISSSGEGMQETAAYLVSLLQDIGAETQIIPTNGHAVVYGELKGESDFTALMYGHYDVMAPDPIDQWHTPPFEPTIKDGRLYGRGVGDNKGQLLAQFLGVKSFLELHGKLPFTLKFVFEGEEEQGSVNLPDFVHAHKDGILQSDVAISIDGSCHQSGAPVLRLGVRGMLYIEIEAVSASLDNHSGNTGNVIENPAWKLINLLTQLRNQDGHVTIKNFYKGVRKPTEQELNYLKQIPYNAAAIADKIGLSSLTLDKETYFTKLMYEPSFNISGIHSGYTDTGTKTVIPSKASVKIDMRLVGDQDPHAIFEEIKTIIEPIEGVMVKKNVTTPPSSTSIDSIYVQPILAALEKGFGEQPVLEPVMPGTLPNYVWTNILNVPVMIVPYANFDQNNHAPNENMLIRNFESGIQSTYYMISELATLLEKE